MPCIHVSGKVSYKYIVRKEHEKDKRLKYLWEHLVASGHLKNRCLQIPKERRKQGGIICFFVYLVIADECISAFQVTGKKVVSCRWLIVLKVANQVTVLLLFSGEIVENKLIFTFSYVYQEDHCIHTRYEKYWFLHVATISVHSVHENRSRKQYSPTGLVPSCFFKISTENATVTVLKHLKPALWSCYSNPLLFVGEGKFIVLESSFAPK